MQNKLGTALRANWMVRLVLAAVAATAVIACCKRAARGGGRNA